MVSLLTGASAMLLIMQENVGFDCKIGAIGITLAIGLITAYMSKRISNERCLVDEALAEAGRLLLKNDPSSSALSAGDLAAMLANELKLATERDRLTFEYGDRFVFKLDKDGKIANLNRYPECFMGFSKTAITGVPLVNLATPDSVANIQEALDRCRTMQQTTIIEIEMRKQDGDTIDLACLLEWSQRAAAFYCVGQDITERKRIERYRAEVTAMLGHDLRGPLASLQVLLESALIDMYGKVPDKLRQALERAQSRIEMMISLINRLLDAEKLETAEQSANKALFSCQDLVSEVAEVFADLAKSKDIVLECRLNDVDAFADYDHAVQIVSNLLSNAIKFAPAKSVILLECLSKGDMAQIDVSDQGPGVPAELTHTLFDRYKSMATGNEPVASSGLGLFIARKLARLQGGDVGFRPNSGGIGTTFWLAVPVFTESHRRNPQNFGKEGLEGMS